MRLAPLLVVAALLPAPALPQASRPATPGFAQAERNAVELKQGMTPQEVRELLGKPRRTALKRSGPADAPGQSTLQWVYVWTAASRYTERSLSIDFSAKGAEDWTVNSWDWSIY
jgi:hypothetical protein